MHQLVYQCLWYSGYVTATVLTCILSYWILYKITHLNKMQRLYSLFSTWMRLHSQHYCALLPGNQSALFCKGFYHWSVSTEGVLQSYFLCQPYSTLTVCWTDHTRHLLWVCSESPDFTEVYIQNLNPHSHLSYVSIAWKKFSEGTQLSPDLLTELQNEFVLIF